MAQPADHAKNSLYLNRSAARCLSWAQWPAPAIDKIVSKLRGAIRKFSAWPSSVQNKIKIVFACYSSMAQNTKCTMWLLGYKYFVHFSLWTQCLSDGVENANTRTVHKFLKNFSNNTDVYQQKFISQLVIQDETWIHHFDSESAQQSMQWNERNRWIIVISLHCVTLFFPCRMQTTDDR